ncbi:hypothetical protein LTR84_000662 [Exophiala bonariae]|uniref:Mid2 domain-containing protein n=1 Tax=Exophiala bonariae TaxID=1690606 RepID=A0AAV9NRJ3_9EURO|nr:hypothetical protein LTR84_000662 [Exophiala bonariae]
MPGSTTSPTAQGVISMLSKYPLTVCPSDMVDLDPVCCPIGFSHYGQHIIGNLPCYSTLTTTVYSPDASVLASITSVVAASIASASTTTTPTISVIVNQVFALGLPCADDEGDGEHSGLSIGAKAGIGAGAGVGALLILFAIIACFMVAKRRRKKNKQQQQQQHDPTTSSSGLPVPQMMAGTGSGVSDGKHLSAATTMTPGSPIMFPQPQTQPQMNQYIQPQYPGAMGGQPQSHGYSPAFGHSQPLGPPQMVQDQYGGMYNMQPTASQPYPYQYPSPSLMTGQQAGMGMPYSPTYNQQPSAPPLQQFYPYEQQHQYQYQNQNQHQYQQQRSTINPHAPVPVEADSGTSGTSNFHASSSLSSPSQPGLSISMTTPPPPPVSHDRNGASQPTSSVSVNGGPSVAELSSHGGGSTPSQDQSQDQSQRHLINRKSVPGWG